ncbi:MAG: immunoglobulin-like domain-containing protein, partial [Lachnospiraceae bacterium]|nr:immunoglobulin-like domain-containing protein [Lachnospiraceae bacterium]
EFTFAPLYRLTFSGAPDGTAFVVKQGETEIAAEADGSYLLETGTYTYTASAFGYETGTGIIEIESADVAHPVSLAVKTGYAVSFNITRPEDITEEAAIEVKYGNKVITASEVGKYNLPAGEYTYTVTCEGCETETGTFMVENTAKTVNVGLIKKLLFEDFFTQITEKATVTNQTGAYSYNPVKDGDEKYLQSSNKTSGSTSTITFEFKKPAALSFEYMVSEEGSTSTSSNYGLIIKRNGTQIAGFEEVSDAWKTYQISADAGDKVTLVYSCYKNDYSMTQSDENWLRLKNFNAEPLTKVTFDGMPENAVVTVRRNAEVITPADGKYLLPAGIYEYEVKAFGYEAIWARSFTLDGTKESMTETVTMTPTQRVNVTFAITGSASGASVVVKNSTGEIMAPTAENSMIYSLPKDEEYLCEISAEGYISAEKHFKADAGKTITVALVSAGEAWDGTTKSEPNQEKGVYQIANGAELAWFAEQVSSTPSISGKLTANINLGGKTWSGFGAYDYSDDASGFAGTLDGDGYTISGLSGSSGLVNCLAPYGTIKNLTVEGEISGSGIIGGIANTSKGTIENCVFKGSITNSGNSGTGGIAGRAIAGNKITGCISTATVKNTYAYYNSELKTGGIAGYTYGTIENCYFTGEVQADASRTTNKAIGGIAGTVYTTGAIKSSYTIGSVTGPEAGIGAVAGSNSGAITNVYYLEGTTANAVASNSASSAIDVSQKTSGEMKEGLFAYTLGDAFNQDDAADSINSGYPVLKWQGGKEPSVPQFEQDVLFDMNSIVLKDAGKAASIEASKKQVRDDLARDGMFAKEWETIGTLNEEEKEARLTAGYNEYLQYQLELMEKTIDEIYEIMGIDQSDDGTLQANSEGIYEFRNEITIAFPEQGEKGSSISWSSSNEDVINPSTGLVNLPVSEKAEITLTASVTKGNILKTKEFKFIVYSDSSQDEQVLEEIKEKAEQTSNFVQPLQMYNHTNMREVMEQWLSKRGYKTQAIDGSGITVEFISAGTKAMPSDDKTYIGNDGAITYFTGSEYGYGTKYALYNDVKFKLKLNEAEKEVSVRAHIGWDAEYVQNLLDDAMSKITWDSIKGNNTNTSKDEYSDGWNRTVVEGDVT